MTAWNGDAMDEDLQQNQGDAGKKTPMSLGALSCTAP